MIAAAALAMAGWSMATVAQPAPARALARVPAWTESHIEEGNPAIVALYRLAVCAQRNRPEAAEALLASARGSDAERTAANALIIFSNRGERRNEWCLTGGASQFRINNIEALRGAVAESFYNGNAVQPRGEAPLPVGTESAASGSSRDVVACAVARRPLAAHRILQVNYGSPTETRLLRAFNAELLACLPPALSLRVSRLGVRTSIAEALLTASRRHQELFTHA